MRNSWDMFARNSLLALLADTVEFNARSSSSVRSLMRCSSTSCDRTTACRYAANAFTIWLKLSPRNSSSSPVRAGVIGLILPASRSRKPCSSNDKGFTSSRDVNFAIPPATRSIAQPIATGFPMPRSVWSR